MWTRIPCQRLFGVPPVNIVSGLRSRYDHAAIFKELIGLPDSGHAYGFLTADMSHRRQLVARHEDSCLNLARKLTGQALIKPYRDRGWVQHGYILSKLIWSHLQVTASVIL